MKNGNWFSGVAGVCTLVGITLVVLAMQLTPVQAAPLELPPLPPPPTPTPLPPTPTPTPLPAAPSAFTGGFVELRVQFSQAWPWGETHWQNLWTVVQWQDDTGVWRDVEGWQGTLHEVVTGADGMVVGHKTWWLAEDDLGEGPLRWRVYRSKGGALIGTSETFDMPSQRRATTTVEVTLAQ